MKRLIASSLIVLVGTAPVSAEEVLREISWSALSKAGKLVEGELQTGRPPEPSEQLKIENPSSHERAFPLLVINRPGILSSQYAVTGRVRCKEVEGKGYLEMDNHFSGNRYYFTRTLASSGLLQNLEGTSPWRPFSLPFTVTPGTQGPEWLQINVVLRGRGTVYLSPLRLVQYADDEDPLAIPGQWWDDRTGGLLGGIGGGILGCLGGLIGVLSGLGKARRLVLWLTTALLLTGLLLVAAGIVAAVQSQPYGVCYPILLLGTISSAVCGGMLPALRRRYEQLELRKMTAIDAAPSGTAHREPHP